MCRMCRVFLTTQPYMPMQYTYRLSLLLFLEINDTNDTLTQSHIYQPFELFVFGTLLTHL